MEPFSKMGNTVERVEFVGKGQVTSDVSSERCQQIGSVGCMGLGLRGEIWAGTIDVGPCRWRLKDESRMGERRYHCEKRSKGRVLGNTNRKERQKIKTS